MGYPMNNTTAIDTGVKVHVLIDGKLACRPERIPVGLEIRALEVPEKDRCMRNGCKQLWPDYNPNPETIKWV